jgi:hypothetical protein
LGCFGEFALATPTDEDIGSFGDELLCGGEADAGVAACNECDLSAQFAHCVCFSLALGAADLATKLKSVLHVIRS